jgi:hypothetical protein
MAEKIEIIRDEKTEGIFEQMKIYLSIKEEGRRKKEKIYSKDWMY